MNRTQGSVVVVCRNRCCRCPEQVLGWAEPLRWSPGTDAGASWNKCSGWPEQVREWVEQLLWHVGTTAVARWNKCCGVREQVQGELEPVRWSVGTPAVASLHTCRSRLAARLGVTEWCRRITGRLRRIGRPGAGVEGPLVEWCPSPCSRLPSRLAKSIRPAHVRGWKPDEPSVLLRFPLEAGGPRLLKGMLE